MWRCAFLCGCVSAVAAGQVAEPVVGPATLLQPVDAGTADVSSLSSSLLVVQPDLRVGAGFEHVYRTETGAFYRVQGALVATFPRSEYVPTREGEMAVIPAGTVFSFGAPVDFQPRRSGAVEPFGEGATATNRSSPTDGVVGRSVSAPVGRTLATPIESRLTPRTLASPERPVQLPAAVLQRERTLDVSNEFYRRYRLEQISGKYGPVREAR